MKNLVQFVFVFLLVVTKIVSATTTTINFEDLSGDTVAQLAISDGYNFVGDNFGAVYYTNGSFCDPSCVSNGTRTLLALGPLFGYAEQLTMTQSGGGDFRLSSVDAGGVFTGNNPEYDAAQIGIVELLGGVTVATGSIALVEGPDGVANFQTFNIGDTLADTVIFTGLGSDSGNNGFSLDNLIVQDSTVPEPGTVALLSVGMLVLLSGARRRRKSFFSIL